MRRWAALALLAVAGCSVPRSEVPSLGSPEEQHQRILDRIAGSGVTEELDDSVLELRLTPPPPPRRIRGPMNLLVELEFGQEVPIVRRPDYGLYANPIP